MVLVVGFVWHFDDVIVETQWVFWVKVGLFGFGFVNFSLLCVCVYGYKGRKV